MVSLNKDWLHSPSVHNLPQNKSRHKNKRLKNAKLKQCCQLPHSCWRIRREKTGRKGNKRGIFLVISKHCSSKFCILWQHETNHCTDSQQRALLDKGKILLLAELSGDCVPAKWFRSIPLFFYRLLSRTQGGWGALVHLRLSQGEWMSCRGHVERQTAVHSHIFGEAGSCGETQGRHADSPQDGTQWDSNSQPPLHRGLTPIFTWWKQQHSGALGKLVWI